VEPAPGPLEPDVPGRPPDPIDEAARMAEQDARIDEFGERLASLDDPPEAPVADPSV
jgi:hypothetical protein